MSKGYVGDAMLDEATAVSYLTYAENWAEGEARLTHRKPDANTA